MLYSTKSAACQINANYLQNFQKPLDVYSTTAASGAQLIDSQFSNVGSPAWWFNSATLNASAPLIWQALNNSEVVLSPSVTTTSTPLATSSTADLAASSDGGDEGDVAASTTSSSSFTQPTRAPTASRTFARRQAAPTTATAKTGTAPTPTQPQPGASTTPASAAYLIAIVANVNAQFVQPSSTASAAAGGSSSGPSTGLAMIILCASRLAFDRPICEVEPNAAVRAGDRGLCSS